MSHAWTSTDLLSLLKFVDYLQKRTSSAPSWSSVVQGPLRSISDVLNKIHFDNEDPHSSLNNDWAKKNAIGEVLGRLNIDLNLLDSASGSNESGNIQINLVAERLREGFEVLNSLITTPSKEERSRLEIAIEKLSSALFSSYPSTSIPINLSNHCSPSISHGKEKGILLIDMREPDSPSWPHPHPRLSYLTLVIEIHENYSTYAVPGGRIEVICEQNATVGELKGAVRGEVGVPVRQLLLSFRGCLLDNGEFKIRD
jgi:hypothetical protein